MEPADRNELANEQELTYHRQSQ